MVLVSVVWSDCILCELQCRSYHLIRHPGLPSTRKCARRDGSMSAASFRLSYDTETELYQKPCLIVWSDHMRLTTCLNGCFARQNMSWTARQNISCVNLPEPTTVCSQKRHVSPRLWALKTLRHIIDLYLKSIKSNNKYWISMIWGAGNSLNR